MATYVFKAMDLTGAKASGEVEADSKQVVAEQLKARGLIVTEIADKHGSREISLNFFKRIKATDLTIMTRQLSTMVSSGMTILRALYVLEAQTENELLAATIVQVRKDVEAGIALSDALERHPKVFNGLYVAMTRAGETGGVLDSALIRVADQLESEDSLRRQVRAAMAYPAVVMGFAFTVLIALVAFLVPVFIGVFKQFGGDLPTITKFTVKLSNIMTGYWWACIAGTVGAIYLFRKWKSTDAGSRMWDKFKLDITAKTAGNHVIETAMDNVIESVKQGGTISGPLKESAVFPGMVSHMVGVGEETGALDTMLSKIADFYEDQVNAAVKQLTSILEPVMIVFVGGMVGFIVISMYMPLFKVYDQIK
jgi:type IV pilus assembly protein PilC